MYLAYQNVRVKSSLLFTSLLHLHRVAAIFLQPQTCVLRVLLANYTIGTEESLICIEYVLPFCNLSRGNLLFASHHTRRGGHDAAENKRREAGNGPHHEIQYCTIVMEEKNALP